MNGIPSKQPSLSRVRSISAALRTLTQSPALRSDELVLILSSLQLSVDARGTPDLLNKTDGLGQTLTRRALANLFLDDFWETVHNAPNTSNRADINSCRRLPPVIDYLDVSSVDKNA